MPKKLELKIDTSKISYIPPLEIRIYTDHSFRLKTSDALGWSIGRHPFISPSGRNILRREIRILINRIYNYSLLQPEKFIVDFLYDRTTSADYHCLWFSVSDMQTQKLEKQLKKKTTGYENFDKFLGAN